MAKTRPQYYRAKEGFSTEFEGERLNVAAGELVIAGHPILKRREDLFEPVASLGRFAETRPEVEQATQAPGEKRGAASEPEKKAESPKR